MILTRFFKPKPPRVIWYIFERDDDGIALGFAAPRAWKWELYAYYVCSILLAGFIVSLCVTSTLLILFILLTFFGAFPIFYALARFAGFEFKRY